MTHPELSQIMGLPEEHPLTIDMDLYPYIVEEILDKRIEEGTKKVTEYLVKWFGYPQEEATWEPEEHLSQTVIQEYEEDMAAWDYLAGPTKMLSSANKTRGKCDSRKNSQASESGMSQRHTSWQARRKKRLEEILARKLLAIKSIRLRDGTLEFLCLWDGEACAQIVPRSVLMMRDDYKQKLLEFYEKFVVLAKPSPESQKDDESDHASIAS